MNNKPTLSNSQTDWQRLDAMSDEDIDLSDCPEITPEMFAKSLVRRSVPVTKDKTQVTLSIDNDVFEGFQSQGREKLVSKDTAPKNLSVSRNLAKYLINLSSRLSKRQNRKIKRNQLISP